MTKTEHYQLNQGDATDPVRREDFNADNARIDVALETVKREAAAGRQALDEAVTALVAGLGKGGTNARIAWGSYTGDGTYGESNPITLTCDFKPMAVFIQTSHNSLHTELFMIDVYKRQPTA